MLYPTLMGTPTGSPVFTSPSYAWQDHLNEQLAARGQSSEATVCGQSGPISRSDSASRREGDRRRKRRTDLGAPLRLDIESANQQALYPASTSANGPCRCILPAHAIYTLAEYQSEAEGPDSSGVGKLSLDPLRQVRYFGESSGLSLLSHCPRSDTLYSQQLWCENSSSLAQAII